MNNIRFEGLFSLLYSQRHFIYFIIIKVLLLMLNKKSRMPLQNFQEKQKLPTKLPKSKSPVVCINKIIFSIHQISRVKCKTPPKDIYNNKQKAHASAIHRRRIKSQLHEPYSQKYPQESKQPAQKKQNTVHTKREPTKKLVKVLSSINMEHQKDKMYIKKYRNADHIISSFRESLNLKQNSKKDEIQRLEESKLIKKASSQLQEHKIAITQVPKQKCDQKKDNHVEFHKLRKEVIYNPTRSFKKHLNNTSTHAQKQIEKQNHKYKYIQPILEESQRSIKEQGCLESQFEISCIDHKKNDSSFLSQQTTNLLKTLKQTNDSYQILNTVTTNKSQCQRQSKRTKSDLLLIRHGLPKDFFK